MNCWYRSLVPPQAMHLAPPSMLLATAEALQSAVVTAFRQLGADQPDVIHQKVLLQEDRFSGYRFLCGELQAIWMAGTEEVVFLDVEGERQTSVGLAAPSPLRRAACTTRTARIATRAAGSCGNQPHLTGAGHGRLRGSPARSLDRRCPGRRTATNPLLTSQGKQAGCDFP